MSKVHSFFLLLIFLFSGHGLLAMNNKDINWQEEIDGLKRELKARHVDLFFHADSNTFNKGLEGVIDRTEGKSVLEVAIMLQQVVARLGDANTQVNFNYLIDNKLILPFQCYWFSEGLYVSSYWKDYEQLEGKRIVAINNFPIGQIVDSISTLISGITPSRVKSLVPRMLVWGQVLEYFGFAQVNEIEIKLEDSTGNISSEIIPLPSPESERIRVISDPPPLGWVDRNAFFRDQYFQEDKLYYIQYNKCWSREAEEEFGSGATALFMPSFKEFEKEALKTARKQNIKKLVIDFRFNSGGNPIQWTKFTDKLQKTRIGENADTYLLVGRNTSSAAIINAIDVIKTLNPLVVGEESGGKPNDFGEMKRFVLTTSNLVVTYSTKYFSLVEDDPPAILPDIPVSQSYKSYITGIDEAMEVIYNHADH